LTDARNTQQAEFEAEGLPQVCGTMQKKFLRHIFSTIQKFMGDCLQFDDMTAAISHDSGTRHREYVSRQIDCRA